MPAVKSGIDLFRIITLLCLRILTALDCYCYIQQGSGIGKTETDLFKNRNRIPYCQAGPSSCLRIIGIFSAV